MDRYISGSRNCKNGEVTGSRNRKKGEISGSRNRQNGAISGSRNCKNGPEYFWIQKSTKWCDFWIQT